MLQLVQVHIQPLERFKRAVGVGNITGPYGPYGRRQKYYSYNSSGEDTVETFRLLRPYLSPIKTAQGDAALEQHFRRKGVPLKEIISGASLGV